MRLCCWPLVTDAVRSVLTLFFFMQPPPPKSTLFPYTTLFRSVVRSEIAYGLISRFLDPGGTSSPTDRKSTRLNSSHGYISYAVFRLKKKNTRHCLAKH